MSWNCPESTHSAPRFDVPWGSGSDPTAKSLNSGPSPVQSWAAGCQPTWWSFRVSRKPRQHEPPWTGNPWWRAHHWWCATGTAEKKERLGVACSFVVVSPVRRSRSCWTLLDFVGATNPRKKTFIDISTKNHSWIILANSAKKLGHHCSVKP